MAVDMFLKLKGIEGESQDAKHKNEIDVLAWSWGLSQSGTFHMGSGGGSGKANFQDISFTKYIDSSSTALMLACATGEPIGESILVVRKAGKEQEEYLTITLTDCLISSFSTGGSGGEDRLTENLSINFAKVNVVYKPQAAGGRVAGNKTFNYDIAANKA
jgi:type VI secretion system secreted protein Hcp